MPRTPTRAPDRGQRRPGPRRPARAAPRARYALRRAVALAALLAVAGAVALVSSAGLGPGAGRGRAGRSPTGGRGAVGSSSTGASAKRAASAAGGSRPGGGAGRAGRRGRATAERHAAGPPYAVGILHETLLEPATAQTATGRGAGGEPVRALAVSIRYPAAPGGGPFPLIVFSQGYATPVGAYAGLLDAWARSGFVVASPTYPHTDPAGPGELDESDIVNHPGDLRFVIGVLARQAGNRAGPLHDLVDPSEIAVAGQSDGGDVSLAVAADSCCEDAAVRAAVIMSGAELPSFGGAYFTSASVPLLVTQGDADTINVPACSAQLYDQAPEPKYYVDLLGQSHLPPYVDPGPARDYVAGASIAFLRAYLQGRGAALRALVAAGGRPGVATITSAPQLAGIATACP